jgi:hypothetical protein
MNFFPNLVAILAILLPPGSGEIADPIVVGPASTQQVCQRQSASDLFLNPTDAPPSSESFFECLDESALDEEDSTRVEEHGIAALTFLDFETRFGNDLLACFPPATSLSRIVIITPILRC